MRFWLFVFTLIPGYLFSQIREFDHLEMLYDQGKYINVYRKSKRMLDNPEYDFSLLPSYYKSISTFQLYKNKHWHRRGEERLEEAKDLFLSVKHQDQNGKLFSAHYYEILALKKDLQLFLEQSKNEGNEEVVLITHPIVSSMLRSIEDTTSVSNATTHTSNPVKINASESETLREKMVLFAEKYLGSPYKYGGENPEGFDCSGFTSFVMHEFGKDLPRMSSEQYKAASKLKLNEAKPGDLVFFDSGSGVNHVGIVVSNENGNISMIHSSTSSGVIITNISLSDYWSKRLKAVGTYL